MTEEYYRHLYVVIEQIDGKILPVSFEMLGEARRLFDDFNAKYSSNEKVVAIVLGHNIKDMSKKLIEYQPNIKKIAIILSQSFRSSHVG